MSLDSCPQVNVNKVKHFTQDAKSLVCFLDQFARNVTILLVEKQELCDNVIGEHVLEDIGFADTAEDLITDFTIVGF